MQKSPYLSDSVPVGQDKLLSHLQSKSVDICNAMSVTKDELLAELSEHAQSCLAAASRLSEDITSLQEAVDDAMRVINEFSAAREVLEENARRSNETRAMLAQEPKAVYAPATEAMDRVVKAAIDANQKSSGSF